MKYANSITIRVFIKQEENKQEIQEIFFDLIGCKKEDLEKEKITYTETTAKGFNEKPILIITATLQKDRHCNELLQKLKENLPEKEKQEIKNQTNRLDQNLDFFIRLSKKELLYGIYSLTDTGDCYHIKISIAAFPRNKEQALKTINSIF